MTMSTSFYFHNSLIELLVKVKNEILFKLLSGFHIKSNQSDNYNNRISIN